MSDEDAVQDAYTRLLKQSHPDTIQRIKEQNDAKQIELYNMHKKHFIKRHGANEDGSANIDGYAAWEDEKDKKHFTQQALHTLLLNTLEHQLGDRKSAEAMFEMEEVGLHGDEKGVDYFLKEGAKEYVDFILKQNFDITYDDLLQKFEETPSILAAYHDDKAPIHKFLQQYIQFTNEEVRDGQKALRNLDPSVNPASQQQSVSWINDNLLGPLNLKLKDNSADLQFLPGLVASIGRLRANGVNDEQLKEQLLQDKVHIEETG